MNRREPIAPIRWAMRHPRLAAWSVLSVGMIILLVIEARDIGLLPLQWVALLVACVLVAGACVWIISWEDSEEEDTAPNVESSNVTPPATELSSVNPVTEKAEE